MQNEAEAQPGFILKTKKSSRRKNMNEEAGNYYSEMLKIQKEVDETVDGSDLREVDERG